MSESSIHWFIDRLVPALSNAGYRPRLVELTFWNDHKVIKYERLLQEPLICQCPALFLFDHHMKDEESARAIIQLLNTPLLNTTTTNDEEAVDASFGERTVYVTRKFLTQKLIESITRVDCGF
jgi:hypothetical protein